jgi:hypothetical protein
MLVPSLVTLTIATVTAFVSFNTDEEIFRVSMAFASALSTILTLIFAPWLVKLIIVAVPLVLEKLNSWSMESSKIKN